MKVILILLFIQFSVLANHKSLCKEDNRKLSFDSKIARIRSSAKSMHPCTATLISESCLITAGHCYEDGQETGLIEFDVPLSDSDTGKLMPSLAENSFSLKKIFGRKNAHHGKDWMVFSVNPNEVTGLNPGQERGFYELETESVTKLSMLTITGYGLTASDEKRNVQQSSHGDLLATDQKKKTIQHKVDTTAGNSGSAIIENLTNRIIGIHTHGGCRKINTETWQGNIGTLIVGNIELIDAIKKCINNKD